MLEALATKGSLHPRCMLEGLRGRRIPYLIQDDCGCNTLAKLIVVDTDDDRLGNYGMFEDLLLYIKCRDLVSAGFKDCLLAKLRYKTIAHTVNRLASLYEKVFTMLLGHVASLEKPIR